MTFEGCGHVTEDRELSNRFSMGFSVSKSKCARGVELKAAMDMAARSSVSILVQWCQRSFQG